MKKILLTACLLYSTAMAQTTGIITIDAGKILNSKSYNHTLALGIGLSNWQHDQGSIGVVMKTYNKETIFGLRLAGSIRLIGDHIIAYTEADAFFYPNQYFAYTDGNGNLKHADVSEHVELGAGLGYRYNSFFITAGIRSDDYDPSRDYMIQPAIVSKITYSIRFKKLTN